MKNTSELRKEILIRAGARKQKREARIIGLLSGASLTVLGMLAVLIISAPVILPGELQGTVLGAFLLGPETGGYVLVGLITFAAGVILTLLIHRRRKTGHSGMDKEQISDRSGDTAEQIREDWK